MELLIIRHGQTAGNLAGRYIGRTDEPLSAPGIAAVRRIGSLPQPGRVYVSPLQRTRETAALLFPGVRQIEYPDLREMDFGDFEGRNADEMAGDAAYRAWVTGECLAPCPNGDSFPDFSRRVAAAFARIVGEAIRRGEDSLVIVAHGGTIMAVMQAFARPGLPLYSWHVPNASGFRARIDAAGWAANPAITDYVQLEVPGL